MSKIKGGVKNPRYKVINRRKSALARLKAQLKKGTKPEKDLSQLTRATTGGHDEPLTEADVKRIKKEIEILESRTK